MAESDGSSLFTITPCPHNEVTNPSAVARRVTSDEHYVLDLCDTLLGEAASGTIGSSIGYVATPVRGYRLTATGPVTASSLSTTNASTYEPVAIFDKPNVITVSGVHRGEQRRLYDLRRQELVPAHGLRLVVIRSTDLAGTGRRLRRDVDHDAPIISNMLGAG
jgi:hypothetical protein